MDSFDKKVLREFREMEKQIGRMMRNMALPSMVNMQSAHDVRPAVDLYEIDGEFYVYLDVAGVSPEDLEVIVERTSVQVSGLKKLPSQRNVLCVHQLEIEQGAFKRSVSLPAPIDVSKTTSVCKNGILIIRLPKEKAKGKLRITIK
jgi:HSP20 family protein